MTTFYTFTKDSEPDSRPIVAVDHEDRVYFYLGNTKLWHHSRDLEVQLDTNDADWTATGVPAAEVPALIAGVKKMDGRGYSGRELRDLKAQPPEDKLTSAELGLFTAANARPVAGGDVRELLEALPVGASREVARYADGRKAVAQNLSYEINSGQKKSLKGLSVSAKTVRSGKDVVVKVRRESKQKSVGAMRTKGARSGSRPV
ncbi:hypothetical protein ACTXJK_15180 [Brachybacterium tyrofermentans]|uniref:hypothetical protein n=1 Tax=Brachybacterium tyrofermentans TaxID=47848 RepID=UPI003FB7DB36